MHLCIFESPFITLTLVDREVKDIRYTVIMPIRLFLLLVPPRFLFDLCSAWSETQISMELLCKSIVHIQETGKKA